MGRRVPAGRAVFSDHFQALNDLGWVSLLVGWVPFVTWYVITGLAILCDTSAAHVYPRWAGYIAVTMGLGQTSASFFIYFKTGPFAWDGLFAWWLPATWFSCSSWL